MASTNVTEFATELKLTAEVLIEKMRKMGIKKDASSLLTEAEKIRFLEYLQHNDVADITMKRNKITLTRRETSEIRQADSSGRARTIQVEVRKRRTFKRDEPVETLLKKSLEGGEDAVALNNVSSPDKESVLGVSKENEPSKKVKPNSSFKSPVILNAFGDKESAVARAAAANEALASINRRISVSATALETASNRLSRDGAKKTESNFLNKKDVPSVFTEKENGINKADDSPPTLTPSSSDFSDEKIKKNRLFSEKIAEHSFVSSEKKRIFKEGFVKSKHAVKQKDELEKKENNDRELEAKRRLAEEQARRIREMMSRPVRLHATEEAKRVEREAKKVKEILPVDEDVKTSSEKRSTLRRPVKPENTEPKPSKNVKKVTVVASSSSNPSSHADRRTRSGSSGGKGNTWQSSERRRGSKGKVTDALAFDERWRPGKPKGRRNSDGLNESNRFEVPTEPIVRDVTIPETITVADLAKKMAVKVPEIIKGMVKLGQMVTINQMLDQETAMILVEELGHRAIAAKLDDPEAFLTDESAEYASAVCLSRPPVVTVMGHVDHGKTSLLDYIRRTKVASGEAGGITQHIGAYHVQTNGGVVTFIDTPGHEAFTAMRARGAKATDLVILVVAADDGVMPQTKEAVAHAKSANIPIVVAINKIDKPEANADKIRQELISESIVPEEYGGDVPFVSVSAKTGEGIDNLLEQLLLQAEILELNAPVDTPAKGVVIEAQLDKGKGPIATILVQSGTLRRGDTVLVGSAYGKVRALFDENGKSCRTAGPSIPVEIQGLSAVPSAGDTLFVLSDERRAREIALFRQGKFRDVKLARQHSAKLENLFDQSASASAQILSLIVKADTHGSQEALVHALNQLSTDEVRVRIMYSAVGGISESDVNLAITSGAIIIAFNTKADVASRRLAESNMVDIRYHTIIYDVVNEIRSAMSGMLSPEKRENIIGLMDIRQVFHVPKVGAIAGCMVLDGVIKRNSQVRLLRDGAVIFTGELDSLRRFKEDVKEVKAGFECGCSVKNFNDLKVGDQLEIFDITEIARTL